MVRPMSVRTTSERRGDRSGSAHASAASEQPPSPSSRHPSGFSLAEPSRPLRGKRLRGRGLRIPLPGQEARPLLLDVLVGLGALLHVVGRAPPKRGRRRRPQAGYYLVTGRVPAAASSGQPLRKPPELRTGADRRLVSYVNRALATSDSAVVGRSRGHDFPRPREVRPDGAPSGAQRTDTGGLSAGDAATRRAPGEQSPLALFRAVTARGVAVSGSGDSGWAAPWRLPARY